MIIGSIFVLRSFSIKPLSFGRDVLFYLFTIVWIFRIFIVQKGLRPSDAYGFLVFYLVYVLTALVGSRFETMDKEDEDGVDVQKEIEEENAKEERSENCYTWMLPIKPKGEFQFQFQLSFTNWFVFSHHQQIGSNPLAVSNVFEFSSFPLN